MNDRWNAYAAERIVLEPTADGPLSGLEFAAKDVFRVAGHISGAGNPDWLRTHSPSERTAEAISRLLAQGARLRGMTHTDEMMYSLNGQNVHYGTPVNPNAPDRIPGGSSSGSAVAVAAGLADFALGTDTGGSIRVPAAYCGVYGIRPTHGLVPTAGVIPLAPSFDTVGWLARDAQLLHDVGVALLNKTGKRAADAAGARRNRAEEAADRGGAVRKPPAASLKTGAAQPFKRMLLAIEAWELAEPPVRVRLVKDVTSMAKTCVDSDWAVIAPEGLAAWMRAFRIVQGLEIWDTHGPWIERAHPVFAPDIAERFAWASKLKRKDSGAELRLWFDVRARLREQLGDDGLLVIPTVPGPAPQRNVSGAANEERRSRAMQLTCIAGLAGLPQVHIPTGAADGAPIGLSVIAGPGRDLQLLSWVAEWAKQRPAGIRQAAWGAAAER